MQKERPPSGGLIDRALVVWDLPIRPITAVDRLRDFGPVDFRVGWLNLDLDQE
jgi:hypothetical protein